MFKNSNHDNNNNNAYEQRNMGTIMLIKSIFLNIRIVVADIYSVLWTPYVNTMKREK